MFDSVLVANRGEIARRVIATARSMGIRSVAVYSEVDADLPFVVEADEAIAIGSPAPADSYLNVEAILHAARQARVEAIHPGYGFLSEHAGFASAVRAADLCWIGPDPEAITAMGDKIKARNLMMNAGVPVAPGSDEPIADVAGALWWAERIGYPVMVKAVSGGGGIGMAPAHDPNALASAFETARGRAERFFADPAVLVERFVPMARHVEVQILGLADGRVVAVGDRDCSAQRRHQKVVEEGPAPGLSSSQRESLHHAAVAAAAAVDYKGAGTVEMLLDQDEGKAWFLEMNTRLQVEHPVTEMTAGIDLVEQQFLIAAGDPVSFDSSVSVPASGHAIEFRVYAEDPKRFLPGPGQITEWKEPSGAGVRVDAGYTIGNCVTQFYDPLMAKLIVHGPSREQAIERSRRAISDFSISGPKCNLPFLGDLLGAPEFVQGGYDTGLISRIRR